MVSETIRSRLTKRWAGIRLFFAKLSMTKEQRRLIDEFGRALRAQIKQYNRNLSQLRALEPEEKWFSEEWVQQLRGKELYAMDALCSMFFFCGSDEHVVRLLKLCSGPTFETWQSFVEMMIGIVASLQADGSITKDGGVVSVEKNGKDIKNMVLENLTIGVVRPLGLGIPEKTIRRNLNDILMDFS